MDDTFLYNIYGTDGRLRSESRLQETCRFVSVSAYSGETLVYYEKKTEELINTRRIPLSFIQGL